MVKISDEEEKSPLGVRLNEEEIVKVDTQVNKCMIFWCSKDSICQCPFCGVSFCTKHGTKTKSNAWPYAKFANDIPYPYWPCVSCDDQLTGKYESEQISSSDASYIIALKNFLEGYSNEELNKKIPLPKYSDLKIGDVDNVGNNEIRNVQYGVNCEICTSWIEWQRDSLTRKTGRGISGTFWGVVAGSIVAGPIGFLIGLFGGGPLAALAGGPLKSRICEECMGKEIGLCKKCLSSMTRKTHYQNGICKSCKPYNPD